MRKRWMWSLVLALLVPLGARAAITAYDASLIYRQLQILSNHINNIRDTDGPDKLVDDKHQAVIKDIDSHLHGRVVRFDQEVIGLFQTKPGELKVTVQVEDEVNDGKHSWKRKGQAEYVFAQQGNRWLIQSTNVAGLLDPPPISAADWLLRLLLLALGGGAVWLAWKNRSKLGGLRRLIPRRRRAVRHHPAQPAHHVQEHPQHHQPVQHFSQPTAPQPETPRPNYEPQPEMPTFQHRPVQPPPRHAIDLRVQPEEDRQPDSPDQETHL